MVFLSLRSSLSNLPSPLDNGSEMQRQLKHLTYPDNNGISTQSRFDTASIVSNLVDETASDNIAESPDSSSLTTIHAGTGDTKSSVVNEKSETDASMNVERVKISDGSVKANINVEAMKLPSPFSVYQKNLTHAPEFAYAYVISGCNEEAPHRNYLYDISISTYLQREAGSTADVVVFIQMAYESKLDELVEQDQLLLDAMNIHVKYIPKTVDESFYRTMLDKFLILGLVQYKRVLFMDGDVMARGSLDYLFDLSVRGILKQNIVTAGKTEPANGGFFMVSPSDNATDRIMAIIRDKEERGKQLPYPHFDEDIGWGHKIEEGDFARLNSGRQYDKWNFYGAFADQGTIWIDSCCIIQRFYDLTYVYPLEILGLLFHWVKYAEKSVSIIFKHSVENWDVDGDGKLFMEQRLELSIFNDYNFDRVCWNIRPCKTPFKDFIHFTGKSKPWLVSPPEGFETDSTSSAPHFWYNSLHVLNDKMNLGIDFSQWRQFHRPLHGLFPTHSSASKTSYAVTNDQNETGTVEEK